jgi:hypothetical protein
MIVKGPTWPFTLFLAFGVLASAWFLGTVSLLLYPGLRADPITVRLRVADVSVVDACRLQVTGRGLAWDQPFHATGGACLVCRVERGWVTAMQIVMPQAAMATLEGATIRIGGRKSDILKDSFTAQDGSPRGSFDAEGPDSDGSLVALSVPRTVGLARSSLPPFRDVVNWPGDWSLFVGRRSALYRALAAALLAFVIFCPPLLCSPVRSSAAVLLLSVVLISLTVLWYGLALYPDTSSYFSCAESLVAGKGFKAGYLHWPPLFPSILAVARLAGLPFTTTTLVVNCLSLGGIGVLVGFQVRRLFESNWIGSLAAIAVVTTYWLQRLSVCAISEPLFIFMVVAFLFTLGYYLRNNNYHALALATVLAAMAAIQRPPGVTVVASCLLAVLLFDRARLSRRVVIAVSVGALASIPLLLWMLRCAVVAGSPAGPRTASTIGLLENVQTSTSSLASMFSAGVPWLGEMSGLAIFLVLVIGLVAAGVPSDRWKRTVPADVVLPHLLFVVVYVPFVVVLRTIIDFDSLTPRIMSPTFPSLWVLALAVLAFLEGNFSRVRSWPLRALVPLCALVCLAAMLLNFGRTAERSLRGRFSVVGGYAGGYTYESGYESQTIRHLRQHPPDDTVLTNCRCGLHLLCGIRASYPPCEDWPDDLQSGWLVWLDDPLPRFEKDAPRSIEQVTTICDLTVEHDFVDGRIYRFKRHK